MISNQLVTKENEISKKFSYDFKISGVPFRLRSSHDEETVRELVEYVDAKVNEAMGTSKSGSFQNAAVLAALNIAEELILLKKQANSLLAGLEQKVDHLSTELEKSSGYSA